MDQITQAKASAEKFSGGGGNGKKDRKIYQKVTLLSFFQGEATEK